MRPLRNLFRAVALLSASLVPATSMAAYHSWCVTGDPLSKTGSTDSTKNQIVTWVCNNKDVTCCSDGRGTLRWSLACVQWAADYANKNTSAGDYCGRNAWTQTQFTGTEQYFPRDFNIVALSGDVNGVQDAEYPIAASGKVTLSGYRLNYFDSEPYALVSSSATLCNGTIHGKVTYSSSYNDACGGSGASTVTYFDALDQVAKSKAVTQSTLPISFTSASTNLGQMASKIAAYDVVTAITGHDSGNANQITFRANDPEMNVFSINGSLFSNTTSYVFDVPFGSAVIINVSGTTPAAIANAGSYNQAATRGVEAGNLLWNFPDATTLAISSCGFRGSVLAPKATATLINGTISGTVVANIFASAFAEWYAAPYHVPMTQNAMVQQFIKHVVIIMQENRSFDNYFGTYTGADGIPSSVRNGTGTYTCANGTTVANKATHNSGTTEEPLHDYPHFHGDFGNDLAGTTSGNVPLSGFFESACNAGFDAAGVAQAAGYYDLTQIPNYWAYAGNYILQDRMFASTPSYSGPAHNYMVSGWNAACSGTPEVCTPDMNSYGNGSTGSHNFAWDDITKLLNSGPISWKYYTGKDWNWTCATCDKDPNSCVTGVPLTTTQANNIGLTVVAYWTPLLYFPTYDTNQQNGRFADLFGAAGFFTDVQKGTLPQVSWIVPEYALSEHSGNMNVSTDIRWGQSYVTSLINAIMRNQALWKTTAIFLSWDDWGGFYDHVVPEKAYVIPGDDTPVGNDTKGKNLGYYGFRVPGLLINPWAGSGTHIDHQTLSHDAYLKFIEDLFLNNARVGLNSDGSTDGRSSATIRENSARLGDLRTEFDFNSVPRRRLLSGAKTAQNSNPPMPCNVP